MKKILSNIISSNYITKFDRYVVELGIKGEPKKTAWLTEKQMINLQNCFNKTPKGYSTGNISIVGVFNEKGYYSYSKVVEHEKERYFTIPKQYDLNDLLDE